MTSMSGLIRAILRTRLLRLIGLTLLTASLLSYRSYERRPILGRWSYTFALLLVITFTSLVLAVVGSWRTRMSSDSISGVKVCFDLCVFSWSLAYLLSSWDLPSNAGRISDLDFMGSEIPAAAILEWVALDLFVIAIGMMIARRWVSTKWTNVWLMVAAIIGTALLGEGIARVWAIVNPSEQGYPTHRGAMWDRRYVSLNAQGFRDVSHELPRKAGTRRLLVVGDSFAFGAGITDIHNRFGERLGLQLQSLTGQDWEVINASQPNTDTLQHIQFLKRMLVYQPDAVVLEYVFNDIEYLQPAPQPNDPVHSLHSTLGKLNPFLVIFRNSYLFEESYVRLRLILIRFQGATNVNPYADRTLLAIHLGDLSRFVTAATKEGVSVVGIVPFDNSTTESETSRRRYATFVNTATSAGLPVWSQDGVFDGYKFSELSVNNLDGHPSELANNLLASWIAERLAQELHNRYSNGQTERRN